MLTRWWFQIFFVFNSQKLGVSWSIWRIFFQMCWFNHNLVDVNVLHNKCIQFVVPRTVPPPTSNLLTCWGEMSHARVSAWDLVLSCFFLGDLGDIRRWQIPTQKARDIPIIPNVWMVNPATKGLYSNSTRSCKASQFGSFASHFRTKSNLLLVFFVLFLLDKAKDLTIYNILHR